MCRVLLCGAVLPAGAACVPGLSVKMAMFYKDLNKTARGELVGGEGMVVCAVDLCRYLVSADLL